MKSISILTFTALIMLGAGDESQGIPYRHGPRPVDILDKTDKSEPPVPEKEVKPETKGQFLLIELPERNEIPAMEPWNATARECCSCWSVCCSLHPWFCCEQC